MAKVDNKIELLGPIKDDPTFSEENAEFIFETFESSDDQHMNENGK